MIKTVTRSYAVNVFALWLVSQYVSGFQLAEGWKSLLIVSVGFTLLHLILKPILHFILGVLNFLTLGLIGLVIDAGLLYLLTIYFPQVTITNWYFPGLIYEGFIVPSYDFNMIGTTVVCAFIIGLIRSILLAIL